MFFSLEFLIYLPQNQMICIATKVCGFFIFFSERQSSELGARQLYLKMAVFFREKRVMLVQ